MRIRFSFIFSACLLILTTSTALASIGVGVGTGKIVVDTVLKPGTIYTLPSITVINTGDETANYKLGVAYHEGQKEKMPPKDWFSFEPKLVELSPGKTQVFEVKINVPVKVEPGDYFAYVEASPIKDTNVPGATVSIAAASKLYFKIAPASVWEGVYYRLLSLWREYEPWGTRSLYILGIILALILFRKFFKVQLKATPQKALSRHLSKPLPKDKSRKKEWNSVDRIY